MKRKIISCLICFCLLISVAGKECNASAEGLTMGTFGAIAYAMGNSWGIAQSFTGGVSDVQDWIENQVNTWLRGRSLTEVVKGEVAKVVAGKLIVPASIYNAVKDLWNYVQEESGAEIGQETTVSNLPSEQYFDAVTGSGIYLWNVITENGAKPGDITIYKPAQTSYADGIYLIGNTMHYKDKSITLAPHLQHVVGYAIAVSYISDDEWDINKLPQPCIWYHEKYFDGYTQIDQLWVVGRLTDLVGQVDNDITISKPLPQEEMPDIGGYSMESEDWGPDTNLADLVSDIYTSVDTGDIAVEGESIFIPPQPTTDPAILDGLNDLIGLGQDSAVQERIQTRNQEAIKDSIDDLTDTQEGIRESVNDISQTISEALDVPDSEELPDFKFDLRELFPFCIPFDIYRLLSSFDAEPAAPHVELPIVIDSINFRYNLDLDFSSWNPVAQAMRTAELIVYAIGLAWATGKVIKW